MGDEAADEAAVLALPPRIRSRREQELRPVQHVHQDRYLNTGT